jgi:hypothetical protein
VCFSVSYVCIVCPFVNFERFTKDRLLKHSRSCQTPGVSPAKLEDLNGIKEAAGIFFAESDRDWVLAGADVHISKVALDDGSEKQKTLEGQIVPTINANLTAASRF